MLRNLARRGRGKGAPFKKLNGIVMSSYEFHSIGLTSEMCYFKRNIKTVNSAW